MTCKQIRCLGTDPGPLSLAALIPPEQCRSARDVSDRSDVYSLGLILFEALAGEHPFADARADSAMMASHIGREPPRLDSKAREVPPDLAALIHRMLQKQPDKRPSAAEIATTLLRMSSAASALRATAGPALSPPPPPPPATDSQIEATLAETPAPPPLMSMLRAQSGKLLIAAAGAALLVGVSGLVWVGQALLAGPEPVQLPSRDLAADADLALPPPGPPQPQDPIPPSTVPESIGNPSLDKDQNQGTEKPGRRGKKKSGKKKRGTKG